MKIEIDTNKQEIIVDDERRIPLYSDEGFAIARDLWVKVGWNQKYNYTFTWFGAPIIQLPDDMIRFQEVVFDLKPDVIIETGVAHGGSLIFSASLCKLIDRGRVIGVDIEIRPKNRARIEQHPLSGMITLLEGSSTAPEIVDKVKDMVRPGDKVLVVLDSDHSYAHVAAELAAYSPLVTPGSYIIATDGVMRDLVETPRGHAHWASDNPANAAEDFARSNSNFVIEEPAWKFSESTVHGNVTHWPSAWLKRVS
ncbi:MAG: cephalosporin hydroxylase family protein [Methylocystis sp.]